VVSFRRDVAYRLAIREAVVMACLLMVGFCSTAAGQSRNRVGNVYMMRQYLNQYNKMNDQQRKDSANEAKALIKQSDAQIKTLESKLSSVKSDLENATSDFNKQTKSLDECETDLRDARKKRTEREEALLTEQDANSKYQSIMKRLKESGEESAKHAERILGHGVKDGDPDKLKLALKKHEFKSLEDDSYCAETFKRYKKLKAERADEVKRLLTLDKAFEKLDATVSKDVENQKVLKAFVATARAKKKKLLNEKETVTSELATAKNDREAAQNYLARATGK
jgi:chromosome segregation ATPase